MVEVYGGKGVRTERKKASRKYLVDKGGVNKFAEETEKRLAFPLIRFSADSCEPRNPIDRAGHIGVNPQAQSGLNYIGVSVPVGRLPADQMLALADIADRFRTGELRLTVWQNLVIPNISTASLEAAKSSIHAARLTFAPGRVMSATTACTGNQRCRFSATHTKSHASPL